MLRTILSLLRSQQGATAVEYGLIASIIVLGSLVAIDALAGETLDMWNNVADSMEE